MFFLIIIVLVAIWFSVFWIQPLGVLSLFERLTPNVNCRVRVEAPIAALSFDDGPHPTFTPQVLDILRRYDAKATFFLIGESALLYPEWLLKSKPLGIRSATITIGMVRPSVAEASACG